MMEDEARRCTLGMAAARESMINERANWLGWVGGVWAAL